jgi:hypothetical protein
MPAKPVKAALAKRKVATVDTKSNRKAKAQKAGAVVVGKGSKVSIADDSSDLSKTVPSAVNSGDSPPPSPYSASPLLRGKEKEQHETDTDVAKLMNDVEWLKKQYMMTASQKSVPSAVEHEGTIRTGSDLLLVLTPHPLAGQLRSFSVLPEKSQRQLAIASIRDELRKENVTLSAGGIRSNQDQYEVCVVAFSEKLHNLGYVNFSDLVDPVVKHALMSVLNSEGRKSEDKKDVYKLMLEKGKVRVQRWRLSRRLRSVYSNQLNGMPPEVLKKKEEVRVVVLTFGFL